MIVAELRELVAELPSSYDDKPVLVWTDHWETVKSLVRDDDRILVTTESWAD